jgi:hypothetical protein
MLLCGRGVTALCATHYARVLRTTSEQSALARKRFLQPRFAYYLPARNFMSEKIDTRCLQFCGMTNVRSFGTVKCNLLFTENDNGGEFVKKSKYAIDKITQACYNKA